MGREEMSSKIRTGRSNTMPVELMSAIDEANATAIYITHVVDNIERNKANLQM
jgi:hypothetical protein